VEETINEASTHPEIVAELLKLAQSAANDIGDYDRAGKNARFLDSDPIRPDSLKWKK
jgi:hypothetical protein